MLIAESMTILDLVTTVAPLGGLGLMLWGASSWVRGASEKDRAHDDRADRAETKLKDHEKRLRAGKL